MFSTFPRSSLKLVLLVPCFVGEAVLDEVFGSFEAVVDFDARGFALHCFREEAGDVFTVFGETDDVLLELGWDAHECLSVFQLGCVVISRVSPVILSEVRHLKSVNGVCTTILDSSLRCAAFRMTGDEGAPSRMPE